MQILFQTDLGKTSVEEALCYIEEYATLSRGDLAFASQLAEGASEKLAELDQTISLHCRDWQIGRVAAVDRNILRLALYEMFYMPDIPLNVSINEAVEIAKRFGSDESSKFINGVLGSVVRELV